MEHPDSELQKPIIPIMSHPLSSAWDQPSIEEIEIDDTHALMYQDILNQLLEYSVSIPSGVYEGKMWKRKKENGWLLCWYDNPVDNKCPIRYREILIA